MNRYEHLTDEQLKAKLDQFRDALETLALGESVAVVAGEGRRMEFTVDNKGRAERIMQQLEAEWDRRYPPSSVGFGRAIGIRWR